jgi:3',5'-cyclic AMP phosphodiesterase CpdA
VSWRVAHVSDFHFCATPRRANLWKIIKLRIQEANGDISRIGPEVAPAIWLPESHCPEIAEFLARKIYRTRNEIDLLLISGDIATTGLPEDLRIALRYVNTAPAKTYFGADWNATLKSGAFPIFLLPGNHDRFRNNEAEPGCRTFDLIFESYWGRRDREISSVILNRADSAPLGIIAADLTLRIDSDATRPNRWMRYGQGYAYDDVIAKLVERTREVRNSRFQGIGIVWAIHFPPARECQGFLGYLQLRYHDRVVEAAHANNIKTILAGHVHERMVIRLGELDIVCAGSGCAFGEKHGNWLHNLEFDVQNGSAKLSKKIDYQWDDRRGDFLPV